MLESFNVFVRCTYTLYHAMPYNTIQKIQHTKQPHSVRGRIFCLLFASIECARSNAMRIHGLTWTLSRSPSHHHAVSFMWTQTSCHSVPVCVCLNRGERTSYSRYILSYARSHSSTLHGTVRLEHTRIKNTWMDFVLKVHILAPFSTVSTVRRLAQSFAILYREWAETIRLCPNAYLHDERGSISARASKIDGLGLAV